MSLGEPDARIADSTAGRRFTLVTGATSGLGRALALRIARPDATVGLVGRDADRLAAVRDEIASTHGREAVRSFRADLSSLASVRALADEVATATPQLHAVVHCAAIYAAERTETVDGLERMFATNAAAPFLLTNLLLPRLAAGSGRVIVVSAPSRTQVDLDDLQSVRRFRSLTAFGASKAADLILTFELARRTKEAGITANAVHPGLMRTNLMAQAPAVIRWPLRLISRSPDHAAAAIAPLVTSAAFDGVTGRFFSGGRRTDPPRGTDDREIGRRLWAACAEITGLDR